MQSKWLESKCHTRLVQCAEQFFYIFYSILINADNVKSMQHDRILITTRDLRLDLDLWQKTWGLSGWRKQTHLILVFSLNCITCCYPEARWSRNADNAACRLCIVNAPQGQWTNQVFNLFCHRSGATFNIGSHCLIQIFICHMQLYSAQWNVNAGYHKPISRSRASPFAKLRH